MLATFSTRQLSTVPPQPSASSGFAHASGHSFWIVFRHALSSRWFSLQRRQPRLNKAAADAVTSRPESGCTEYQHLRSSREEHLGLTLLNICGSG